MRRKVSNEQSIYRGGDASWLVELIDVIVGVREMSLVLLIWGNCSSDDLPLLNGCIHTVLVNEELGFSNKEHVFMTFDE